MANNDPPDGSRRSPVAVSPSHGSSDSSPYSSVRSRHDLHAEDGKRRREERMRAVKERQRMEQERREKTWREHQERMERVEAKQTSERKERSRRARERELSRQRAVLERRKTQQASEEEKRRCILAKYAGGGEESAAAHKRPVFAFGSSTPRVLAHLENLPNSQRVYDSKMATAALQERESAAPMNTSQNSLPLSTPSRARPQSVSAAKVAFGSIVRSATPSATPNSRVAGRSATTGSRCSPQRGANSLTQSAFGRLPSAPPPSRRREMSRPKQTAIAQSKPSDDLMVRSYAAGEGQLPADYGAELAGDSGARSLAKSARKPVTSAQSVFSRLSTKSSKTKAPTQEKCGSRMAKSASATIQSVIPEIDDDEMEYVATTVRTPPSSSQKRDAPSSNASPLAPSPPSTPPDLKRLKSADVASGADGTDLPPSLHEELAAAGDALDVGAVPPTTSAESPNDAPLIAVQADVSLECSAVADESFSRAAAVVVSEGTDSPPSVDLVVEAKLLAEPPPSNTSETDLKPANGIRQTAPSPQTEEEAKAALAERRRLAKEALERDARRRQEEADEMRRAQEEQLLLEEEEFRRQEAEELRIVDEARRAEQERLRLATEEAAQREDEERRARQDAERQRAEQERAAEAERQRLERERLEKEQQLQLEQAEREQRKQRLSTIMARTRGTPKTEETLENCSMSESINLPVVRPAKASDDAGKPTLSASGARALEKLAGSSSALSDILRRHGSNPHLDDADERTECPPRPAVSCESSSRAAFVVSSEAGAGWAHERLIDAPDGGTAPLAAVQSSSDEASSEPTTVIFVGRQSSSSDDMSSSERSHPIDEWPPLQLPGCDKANESTTDPNRVVV